MKHAGRKLGPPGAILVATAAALAACALPAPPAASPPPDDGRAGLEVRYLANEGFLVEGAGKRVLVDGLIGDGVTGYAPLPEAVRGPLERGLSPWEGIQLALASHHHRDHFDAASVGRFLEANPEAMFLSTPQAVERLRQELPDRADLTGRARAVWPAEGEVERLEVAGIDVAVLNLHHGRRDPPVENLGFVVTLGETRFLHLGDTEAKMESFAPYLDTLRGTDLALLPFWFLASEWRAAMVRDEIRPRAVVVGHLPTPDAPPGHFGRWRSRDTLVGVIRAGFPDAWVPASPGESYRLSAG